MSDYHALENELRSTPTSSSCRWVPSDSRTPAHRDSEQDRCARAKELAEFVRPEFEKLGLKVFEISTASHEGLKELNFALSALVHEMREEVANREQAEEEARVVIKPLETKGRRPRRADEGGSALEFTVERRELGNGEVFFEVRGVKPERWVMQTNFDNDEAVGYLADRLAKLGVEDELRRKGAHPGDEVRIGRGAVWSNSIGIRPSPLVPKCSTAPTSVPEARICVSKSWTRARTAAPTPNVVPNTTR